MVLLIFVARCLLPLKTVISSHKWFFAVFSENTAFPKDLFDNEISITKFVIKKVILIF